MEQVALNNDEPEDSNKTAATYKEVLKSYTQPSDEHLLNASSILSAFPQFKNRSFALQLARDEFEFGLCENFLLETFGLEILRNVKNNCDDESLYQILSRQEAEEINHVATFKALIKKAHIPNELQKGLTDLWDSFFSSSSIVEQVTKGSIILESLAIGHFIARQRYFPNTSISEIDKRVVREEARHQTQILPYLISKQAQKKISIKNIIKYAKDTVQEINTHFLPTFLIDTYSLDIPKNAEDLIGSSGIIGEQVKISSQRIVALIRSIGAKRGSNNELSCITH